MPRTYLPDLRALLSRGLALLAFLAALFLLPALTGDPNLRAAVPLFLILAFAQLVPMFWSGRPDLFAPPVIMGLRDAFSTAGTLLGFFAAGELRVDILGAMDPGETYRVVERTLFALIVGQVSYLLGYYSPLGLAFRNAFPKVAGLVWDRRRAIILGAIPALAFVAAYAIFQSRVGVSLFDVTQLGAGKRVWRDDPTLSWMMRGVLIGFVPVFLYLTHTLAQRRTVTIVGAGALALIVGILVLRLGQRGPTAYAVLTLVTVFHYMRRRIPVIVFAAVYVVGMGASNILYEWRTDPDTSPRPVDVTQITQAPLDVMTTHEGERAHFGALAVVMDAFPDKHEFLLGQSWLYLLVLPIPRWLWPGKQLFFDWPDNGIVQKLVGVPTPTPYVGVLYANLSWLGVALGMFLFGAFHRALYEWLIKFTPDRNVVLLYAMILHNFAPTLLAVAACTATVLPVWVILRLIGRRPSPLPARA